MPKDGKTVILEDDTSGTYELAHWSAEEGAWVGANGSPCQISPTYWLAMKRTEGFGDECSSASPQRGVLLRRRSGNLRHSTFLLRWLARIQRALRGSRNRSGKTFARPK